MIDVLRSRIRAGRWIGMYHLRVLYRQIKNLLTPYSEPTFSSGEPSVTVFITNLNNRYPLELTLRTLVEHTSYSNYEIWVADNGSDDGSVAFLKGLIQQDWPLRLIDHGEARPQHEWYDFMAEHVRTHYWIGLHEDMIITGDGWLEDLITYMENHPDLLLVGGDPFPPNPGVREPVGGELVDGMEALSTWIFCARKELREYISTSFAFHKRQDDAHQRTQLYDQGGKLIEDLREQGLGFDCMPDWYQNKFYHLGSITWSFNYEMEEARRMFKEYQIADAKRRVERAPASRVKPGSERILSKHTSS